MQWGQTRCRTRASSTWGGTPWQISGPLIGRIRVPCPMRKRSMCTHLRGTRTSRSLIRSRRLTYISACTITTSQMSFKTQSIFWSNKKRIISGMNQWPAAGSPHRTSRYFIKLTQLNMEGSATKTLTSLTSTITVSRADIGSRSSWNSFKVRCLFSFTRTASSITGNV